MSIKQQPVQRMLLGHTQVKVLLSPNDYNKVEESECIHQHAVISRKHCIFKNLKHLPQRKQRPRGFAVIPVAQPYTPKALHHPDSVVKD